MLRLILFALFFFFNDTATTEIYTLSLHDALPICERAVLVRDFLAREHLESLQQGGGLAAPVRLDDADHDIDRKSTRLNSSHQIISYAVFCLKKKNKQTKNQSLSACGLAEHYLTTR